MTGIYRSTYVENGIEMRFATTQLQPTYARRAIPCFDEPEYKATFELQLIRDTRDMSQSNAFLDLIELRYRRYEHTFKTSPYISICHLAFIASELKMRGRFHRYAVWARPEMYNQTEYAFKVGRKMLDHLSEYANYYHYNNKTQNKLDMAAISGDGADGKENYAMTIYRESSLLYDSDKTSAYAKQGIATAIAHGQAHLWFGYLVSTWNVMVIHLLNIAFNMA